MALILNEEQKMLKQSAREFLLNNAPVSQLRDLRDRRDKIGYDAGVWQQMIDMGWTSLIIPENYDGLGFGMTGLGQILEETGRTLSTSPLLSTAILGTSAILYSTNEELKKSLLPKISAGELTLALAHEEGHIHHALPALTRAIKSNGGYELHGTKKFVLDGHVSDLIVVSAALSDSGHTGLFLVDTSREGLSIERKIMMDSRNAAQLTLTAVHVNMADRLDRDGEGHILLTKVHDIGRIALAAELLGVVSEAFDRTMAYLKERKQFGVPIGAFQGLQHRSAHLYCEIELCKTLVLKALHAVDEGNDLSLIASTVKSKLGEVAQLVTNEAIQMYGGIGMTDDEEIGFFLKRARVAQQCLGDYNFHLDRYATLKGF